MHYAAPRAVHDACFAIRSTDVLRVRARGHNHVVAKVSLRALHPACGFTSAVERAVVKKKNMDVSHPGFKCTPLAPDAT